MTKKPNFPLVSLGSSPTCFKCGLPIIEGLTERSGNPLGYGAFRSKCAKCDIFTYWDSAPSVNEAHVLVNARGEFLGDSILVATPLEARMMTKPEATREQRKYPGTYAIKRLIEFDLKAERERLARLDYDWHYGQPIPEVYGWRVGDLFKYRGSDQPGEVVLVQPDRITVRTVEKHHMVGDRVKLDKWLSNELSKYAYKVEK